MKLLMQKLLAGGCAYYIYMCDRSRARSIFAPRWRRGSSHQGAGGCWTSGLAVPHFVIDAPGGGGKIRAPEYVESVTDEEVVLRNYADSATCTSNR